MSNSEMGPNVPKYPDLSEMGDIIGDIAINKMGLKPCAVHYHLVPAPIMYETGAYLLPGHFSHWRFGRDYYKMKSSYDHGFSKIYEMVINTVPSQAFLMENNSPVMQEFVIAHVLGHVDFFQNNAAFRYTNRKKHQSAEIEAGRVRQYTHDYGLNSVEEILDNAFAIEFNVAQDQTKLYRPDPGDYLRDNQRQYAASMQQKATLAPFDDILNLGEKDPTTEEPKKAAAPVPFQPDEDLLWFIANFSPRHLEEWQQDLISIVRNDAFYFMPQIHTKIMNEGWASLWHTRIMRELGDRGLLRPGEDTEWIENSSGVLSSSITKINPYHLGYRMWEYIDKQYHGEFNPEARPTYHHMSREVLDPARYQGRLDHDIFYVRETTTNDAAFIRNYLTDDLIEELELFEYKKQGGKYVITSRNPDYIRRNLIIGLSISIPLVNIAQGGIDYNANRELYLQHAWEGVDLNIADAEKTLKSIYVLWGKPVHLETNINETKTLLSYSGQGGVEHKKM